MRAEVQSVVCTARRLTGADWISEGCAQLRGSLLTARNTNLASVGCVLAQAGAILYVSSVNQVHLVPSCISPSSYIMCVTLTGSGGAPGTVSVCCAGGLHTLLVAGLQEQSWVWKSQLPAPSFRWRASTQSSGSRALIHPEYKTDSRSGCHAAICCCYAKESCDRLEKGRPHA